MQVTSNGMKKIGGKKECWSAQHMAAKEKEEDPRNDERMKLHNIMVSLGGGMQGFVVAGLGLSRRMPKDGWPSTAIHS